MTEMRNAYSTWSGNLTERGHLEDLSVDGMTSEWVLEKYGGKVLKDLSGSE